ncbi:MAG: cytochrome d ubiquinol oxidase subunit II [Chitinispirillaceae bacterium]|nr:cytochrome d ubiquinol oxidase subunit II [Chitinispirillaceae bacterium]
MDAATLPVAAFIILGTVFTVYALLDGFDLGIGMQFPWLGKTEREKEAVLATVAPVWDGNEVWLVMGGSYLFAFFPFAFGAILSTLWMPVLVAVFALMLRAAAFEFWYRNETPHVLWQALLCGASWLVTLIFGIALGCVMAGLDITDRSAGALLGVLFQPLPLATGTAGCAFFLMHGLSWCAVKAPLEIALRAGRMAKRIAPLTLLTTVVWVTTLAFTLPQALHKPLFWIGTTLALAGSAGIISGRLPRLLLSGLAITGAMVAAFASHFPAIIRPPDGAAESLTIYTTSSSAVLLKAMVPFSALWILFIALFTVYVYRTFKGRVTGEEHGY